MHERRLCCSPGQPIELRCLNTDRKNSNPECPTSVLEGVPVATLNRALVRNVALEICCVDFGLKAHEVIVAHCRNELLMAWESHQDLGLCEGGVMKKSDFISMPEPAKLARQ